MTETPHLPPPAPTVTQSIAPGSSAGRPRIWPVALVFVVLAVVTGVAMHEFTQYTHGPVADGLATLFRVTAPLAAAAFTLLVFRVWRRRVAEGWPGVMQTCVIGVVGVGLALGGWGGRVLADRVDELLPVVIALGAVFVVGVALAVGALELGAVAVVRWLLARPAGGVRSGLRETQR